MEWMLILNQVFQVCIVPLLGLLVSFLVVWLTAKKEEIKEKIQNEKAKKYLDMLNTTICECVLATNQTYVDALKDQNIFNEEAQKQALQKTYDAVIKILSEDAKEYLSTAYGDLQTLILEKIESQVKLNKAA